MAETDFTITTELNGEVTQLSEKEIIFLIELRMLSKEERDIILELIEKFKSK